MLVLNKYLFDITNDLTDQTKISFKPLEFCKNEYSKYVFKI